MQGDCIDEHQLSLWQGERTEAAVTDPDIEIAMLAEMLAARLEARSRQRTSLRLAAALALNIVDLVGSR